MTNSMHLKGLDERVHEAGQALAAAGVPSPDVLVFPATGMARLVRSLEDGVSVQLGEVEGVPHTFEHATLVAGRLGDTSAWIIDDAPRSRASIDGGAESPLPMAATGAWAAAFPVWLAAAADAKVLVHLSAGTVLSAGPDTECTPGSVACVTDHINLSGTSPLAGLGESRLGPLFPDQTRLHDAELGALARSAADQLELALPSVVAACTLGPALSTPAELASYRTVGADVAVQRLADPLVAAAHAGLIAIALVAVTDAADEHLDVAQLVARADEVAPRLDALALELVRRAGALARTRRDEASA